MENLLKENEINLRTLFEAGVHFGHPTRKWNPKMDNFIFTKKSKSHVIDLEKTLDQLKKARNLLVEILLLKIKYQFLNLTPVCDLIIRIGLVC